MILDFIPKSIDLRLQLGAVHKPRAADLSDRHQSSREGVLPIAKWHGKNVSISNQITITT